MTWIFAFSILGPVGLITGLVLWNMSAWPRVQATGDAPAAAVSILIPARDEERHIDRCIQAALAQNGWISEVLVYDDESTDGTAAKVMEWATKDSRVRLLGPNPLPEDWCGKTFACAQLAQAAKGDWLLFLDADAELAPNSIGRILGSAARHKATLLACWPAIRCHSFWEHLLMPLLNFSVFTLFPAPLALRDNRPALGLAHGACVLMQRAAYIRVGGHAAVRGEIFEDTALAREWRRHGERSVCLDGQDVASVRMYESLAGIWKGFQKNFYPAFSHDAGYWLFMALHLWCFTAPFGLALVLPLTAAPAWPAWTAAGCVAGMRIVMALRFRYPLWSCILHPVAETLLLALGLSSRYRCRSGKGVEWKGRRYPGRMPSGANKDHQDG